jgi:hypothetical protein
LTLAVDPEAVMRALALVGFIAGLGLCLAPRAAAKLDGDADLERAEMSAQSFLSAWLSGETRKARQLLGDDFAASIDDLPAWLGRAQRLGLHKGAATIAERRLDPDSGAALFKGTLRGQPKDRTVVEGTFVLRVSPEGALREWRVRDFTHTTAEKALKGPEG